MNKQTYLILLATATQKGLEGAKEYLRKEAFEVLHMLQDRKSYGSNPMGADVTAIMKQVVSDLGGTYCSKDGRPARIVY